jgi:hypothetical protein
VFADAGSMQVKRYKHSATPMADGRVMLLGGSDELDWAGARRSVEIYDPASRRSQPAVSMNRARFKFPSAVAVAANGTLVVAGGGRRVEVFDLRQAQFSVAAGSLGDAWYYATATPLADGRVLIAGGYNESLDPTNRVWIYRPPGPTKNALSRHQQSMSGGT